MPDPRDIFSYGVSEPFGVIGPFGDVHTGVDLLLPAGTPVPAEGPGKIESVFYDPTGGQQVKVKYDAGGEGWFAHLMKIFVTPGQRVEPTSEIALSGATGHVTGAHLHFEERDPWGNLIDPMTVQAHTYIGGLADPAPASSNGCPPGQTRNIFGQCTVPFGQPNPPSQWGAPSFQTGPGGTGADKQGPLFDPLSPVAKAVDDFRAMVGTGAREIAIAGVVIGAVAILGYGGVKRALG